ncbi:MAG: outer membrane receptor protein involved in Fe transport [Saprospiraceae bacterium]|jgi:outer membrane receptor protein involved in Fe transport
MARYLLIFSFLLMGLVSATAQSALSGKVTDADTGEPILFGDVVVYRNGGLVTGEQTDFDGNFIISPMDPGTYEVVFKYVGYTDVKYEGVLITADKETTLDATMASGVTLEAAVVIAYAVPLVEQDNTTQGASLTSKDIANLPSKNIAGIISQVAGAGSADEGDAVSIRGSRSDGTYYYIDGIRVSGNLIPQSEIEQLQVITGGIGAKYGDVTGGVISITTKGPSAKFGGGFDVETSRYLDPFGYNLVSAYINGPIIKNKDGNALLGYRISGQYRHLEDDDPSALDIYRINDDALARLEANPTYIGGPNADLLTEDDVDILDVQPFEQNERLDLTAKLDARLSDAIDIAFTGTYSGETDFFTPGETSATADNWRLLNAHNNPFTDEKRYRGNFRFRHRLGKTAAGTANADDAQAAKGNAIRNASYTIQAGLEQYDYKLGDPRHGENLFNYGYVGSFDATYQPEIGVARDDAGNIIIDEFGNQVIVHQGYRQETGENGFTAGDINPVLANYNLIGTTSGILAELPAQNGRTSDLFTDSYNFHSNIGTVYNRYRIRDEQTITAQVNAGFDLLPGGSENGKHSIEFGLLYEQRTNRFYEILPRDLWTVARQQANGFDGIDTSNPLDVVYVNPGDFNDTSSEPVPGWTPVQLYGAGGGVLGNDDFFENIRETLGVDRFTNVNTDALTPDQLSLDMFTATELNTESRLEFNYYGYDYLGNDFDGTFEDFFTRKDDAGNLTRPVAPFRPTYTSAYIQDKFKFRDIIIRAGLRVDSYDANTKVLKDPYSLYELETASSFQEKFGTAYPSTIGDDFAVYTDGQESTSVKAYREGDTWYFPSGVQANSPTEIFGGTIAPGKRVNPDVNIRDENFDINSSFEDYKPQVNLMPRIAFSFPISEDANFFAHYDILVQRPPNNNVASPYEYLNFDNRNLTAGSPKANANLKPEKTIDYEVGFQQKLSNSSALKIAAYYKELRDMIQIRIYQNIESISNYYSYDNLDFGTVKGFSFQYDLRRTGNVQLNASYTLQFADGTGSDANSSRGLGSREVLRALFPLSFDERHRVNINLDYRYSSGKKYNGPELFGKQIFANAGANIQVIAVSGRPYTATTTPEVLGGSQTKGGLNGSRLPWRNTVNFRVDKDFSLRKGKDGSNGLNLNVYFRVANLLNTANIIQVYSATGSPYTDGFLETDQAQTNIEAGANPASYLASYQWRLLNPNFLSLPRRMYIGARVDF